TRYQSATRCSSARTLFSTARRSRTKCSSRLEHHCSQGRLQAADRNCGSTACCMSIPSWHQERSCRSAGSPSVTQLSSFRPISTRRCGGCKPGSAFLALFLGGGGGG